jgi:hypothetical protein
VVLNFDFDMSSRVEVLRIYRRWGRRAGCRGRERRRTPRFGLTLKPRVFERFIFKSTSGCWCCRDTKAKNGMGRRYQRHFFTIPRGMLIVIGAAVNTSSSSNPPTSPKGNFRLVLGPPLSPLSKRKVSNTRPIWSSPWPSTTCQYDNRVCGESRVPLSDSVQEVYFRFRFRFRIFLLDPTLLHFALPMLPIRPLDKKMWKFDE